MIKNEPVHRYLAQIVEHYPEKVAVTDGKNSISFDELNAASDDLARFLVKLGVSQPDRVAYFMHRSFNCIIATIGTLKAGAAYVPVDQKTPQERWLKIMTDSAPKAIICDRITLAETLSRVKNLNKQPYVICLSQREINSKFQAEVFFQDALETAKDIILPDDITLDDIAYVMYTSGSTGAPKGVMVTHGNIRNYIDWSINYFQITVDDRILGTAPFHFDMSTFDIFCMLSTGASLSIAAGENLLFPESLARFIEQEKNTVWKGVSSLLMYMSRAGVIQAERMSTLRTVIFAGEPLASQYLKHWMETYPKVLFFNGYGPTEATGVCLCYQVKKAPRPDQPIPIGQPCKGATVAIINDDELSVDKGEIGELLIAGPCLAKGYLNDPEKTHKYFTSPPSDCGLDERVYRTGDLVRQTDEGDFIFVSRKDQQVKWMGYRIELGEIETNLLAHPQVKDVAVLLANMRNDELVELVAFTEIDDSCDVLNLSAFLKERLPPYMIPKRFIRLNSLPRNDRGKIAREEILKNHLPLNDKDNAYSK